MESIQYWNVLDLSENVSRSLEKMKVLRSLKYPRYARIHRLGIKGLMIDDYLMMLVAVCTDRSTDHCSVHADHVLMFRVFILHLSFVSMLSRVEVVAICISQTSSIRLLLWISKKE